MVLKNQQTKTDADMSQGVGRFYLDYFEDGEAAGVTPTTEIDYFDTFTYTPIDTQILLKSGTPLLTEDVFVGEQGDTITLSGIDGSSILKWIQATGSGTCTLDVGDPTIEEWNRGGQTTTQKCMGRFIQHLETGQTLDFHFYKLVGNGNPSFPFTKSAELNKWEATFTLLYSDTGWIGELLDDGEHYCKVLRTSATL